MPLGLRSSERPDGEEIKALRTDASPEQSPQNRNFHQTLGQLIAIDSLAGSAID